MLTLYAAAIVVGAVLLFWIQLLFARMILPLMGGAPAVWNTCMVFFQAILLAGYVWAHLSTRWLGTRRQSVVHLVLLAAAFVFLPIGVPSGWAPPASANPAPWLVMTLAAAVGLPALAVSATSPLLQKWFARTGHHAAGDPYFLYSAGSLGNLLILVGYPTLLEPSMDLRYQSLGWTATYALLALLIAGCAVLLWRFPASAPAPGGAPPPPAPAEPSRPPSPRIRLRWLLLSMAPSSLLLGVTGHITANIAAVPLLWVIPLSLYLLSFAVVFARRPVLPHRWMVAAQPFLVLAAVYGMTAFVDKPAYTLPWHLAAFFLTAMVCHGELAASRPAADHLTEFYLWLSLGGVMGGMFNTFVTPLVFTSMAEYPLAVAAACLLRPPSGGGADASRPWTDILWPVLLGGGLAALLRFFASGGSSVENPGFWHNMAVAAASLACLGFVRRPLRFGLGLGAVLAAGALTMGYPAKVLFRERNFFGTIKVVEPGRGEHLLIHGVTSHGAQLTDPRFRREPLLYYALEGPLGDIFTALAAGLRGRDVAVVGLGAGSAAAYGQPGQTFVFYEINPAVVRAAEDEHLFTFLGDSLARTEVVVGDARLRLAEAPDRRFSLIILDAYSSDAIPVHLVTREAIRLYLSKLANGGILAFNITNSYLDLAPVLNDLAQDAGLLCFYKEDTEACASAAYGEMKSRSAWLVMARKYADLGTLYAFPGWEGLAGKTGRVWTDGYSNILSAFKPR